MIVISMGNSHHITSPKPEISFKQAETEIWTRLSAHLSCLPEAQKNPITADYSNCLQGQYQCRLIGCLFGSLIGDALGAYCEFQTTPIDPSTLEKTMEMSKGGVFKLYEGQFTDDSEMAFHLLRGLATLIPTQALASQYSRILLRVAKQYLKWEASAPFDIGITCRKGIQLLTKSKVHTQQNFFQAKGEDYDKELNQILENVKQINGGSQSNGSLMRIAPMAIFLALIQEDPLKHADFVKNEIALIHCNQVLKQAGFIWVKVLYDLIIHSDGNKETYHNILINARKISTNREIQSWFEYAINNDPMSACENMGWAKIAWTYGIGLLHTLATTGKELNYQQEIKRVIGRGGDSDTNAAIVGGLLGAVVGFKKLPGSYLSKVFKLQFPDKKTEHPNRPKHFQAVNILKEFLMLFRLSDQYRQNKRQQQSRGKK